MTIEITRVPEVSGEQERRVAFHSFVNVLHVVRGELDELEEIVGKPGLFADHRSTIDRIVESFGALEQVQRLASEINDLADNIKEAIDTRLLPVVKGNPAVELRVEGELDFLEEVFEIAETRVDEILFRYQADGPWSRLAPHDIESSLQEVFLVMAAKGDYGVVFLSDEQTESDYLIDFNVVGDQNGTLLIPHELQDVARDLLANARKYSKPGSTCTLAFTGGGDLVRLVVTDQGRGIPEGEIEDVVAYGVRGSNVGEKETMGGGFGLTKAYQVTTRHGGRMWIESQLGSGTTVTIEIPVPPDL